MSRYMSNTRNKLTVSLRAANEAAAVLAALPLQKRQAVLRTLASNLKQEKKRILAENEKDVRAASMGGRNDAFINRLTLTDAAFDSMLKQVQTISNSRDVLGTILEKRIIAGGVRLEKVSVPLGVIGIIYESRPNVTIDVAALCIMSGNAAVLKGGSDALNTNRILSKCVQKALKQNGLPAGAVVFLDTNDRRVVGQLVRENEYIDVLIPRGGYGLVKKVVSQSKIPVLYHASGGARIFIDKEADLKMAVKVCENAKTNRPATCNSVDTILVHEKVAAAFIPAVVEALQKKGVEVRGDAKTAKLARVKKAKESDYATEFLDYIVVIKVVKDVDEAIGFIRTYTKKHTEGIISRNKGVVEKFVSTIDAAGIFVNCSTRLHDGGVFGLGAEMGVATGKLHARGPVGLRELTTYKWVAYGSGQLRK